VFSGPDAPASSGQAGAVVDSLAPITRKVLLVIYNPTIPSEGGRKLSEVFGWRDPDRLIAALIEDLREVSGGIADYRVAERLELDEFPVKADGYRYTPEEYVRCYRTQSGFHQPDAVDYHTIVNGLGLIERVDSGAIDEVWTISYPWAGFYESRMAGPAAFWCNAPPLEGTEHARRRFIIMAYNYERGVGEALESYGHRTESIMERAYQAFNGELNLWRRFIRHEKTHPGQAEVGNMHFAPNSQRDYDWGNPTPVTTRYPTWQNYPDLNNGQPVQVRCEAWGGGDIREHHRWWFSLLPRVPGQTRGISNNWWEYIIDPNRVR
jgi:hypothetical protein